MVVGLFLCGRDRLARQPLAVHVVSQITFMVGRWRETLAQIEELRVRLSSHFAYTRVVSYSSGGEWKLGEFRSVTNHRT